MPRNLSRARLTASKPWPTIPAGTSMSYSWVSRTRTTIAACESAAVAAAVFRADPLGFVPMSFRMRYRTITKFVAYTANFPPYAPIADANRNERWDGPIYVGEATRKNGRKGGVLAEGPAGKAVFERLGNHADSIREADNLAVKDFWCRYLVLKDFFIPLCESLLIDRYEPIWNKLIDGFGNKALGGPRQKLQQKSMWDVLHSGRTGAAISPNKRYATSDVLVAAVKKFFAGEPVPVISTDDAVDAAHEAGKDDD